MSWRRDLVRFIPGVFGLLWFAGVGLTASAGSDSPRIYTNADLDALAPSPRPEDLARSLVGQSVPGGLRDAWGSSVSLDEPGILYLVDYWAIGCKPCMWEMPDLIRLSKDLSADHKFRMVSVLFRWPPELLEKVRVEYELDDLPLYSDTERAFEKLGLAFPTKLIVRGGKILDVEVGGQPEGTYRHWRDKIRTFLK